MKNADRGPAYPGRSMEKSPASLLAAPRHTLILFGIVTLLVVAGAFNASRNTSVSQAPDSASMIENDVIMIGMLWCWVYFVFKGMQDYGQSIRQFFGRQALTLRALFGDFLFGALAFGLIYASTGAVHALLSNPQINNPLLTATPQGAGGAAVWIALSISAGACEEIVFRGYLQRQLAALTGNAGIAIVVQALVFGAGHAYEGITSVLAIVLHGLVLGFVADWRGNIRAGVVEHAGWDILAGFGLIGANW
jgi:uncharacterized protein